VIVEAPVDRACLHPEVVVVEEASPVAAVVVEVEVSPVVAVAVVVVAVEDK